MKNEITIKRYKGWSHVIKSFSPEITLNDFYLIDSPIEERKKSLPYIVWIECTGLFDVNKVELWQGDILEQEIKNEFGSIQKYIGVMEWNKEFGAWMGHFKGLNFTPSLGYQTLPKKIGHVFTNPELLTLLKK